MGWPLAQIAASPGGHMMLHAAQRPTAGALHDAPVSSFFLFSAFFFCEPSAGCEASMAASSARTSDFLISPPLVGHEAVVGQEPRDLLRRVGSGIGVVAEAHAQHRAVGQLHVESMGSARIEDETHFGSALRPHALYFLAIPRGRDGVVGADQDEERRVEHASGVALAPG